MKVSKKFNLGLKDLTQGLIVAIGAPVLAIIQTTIEAGSFTIDWKLVGITAAGAAFAYLGKKFFQST